MAGERSGELFTERGRAALRRAWAEGLGFALWRLPGADSPAGLVSLRPVAREVVLDMGAAAPGFALSRFDSEDGRVCDLIEGDLRLDGDGEAALSAAGAGFLEGLTGDGPVLPLDGRQGWPARGPVVTPPAAYEALVAKAVAAIGAGEVSKVVASRVVPMPLPAGTDLMALFAALVRAYPAAFVALASVPEEGVWLLASPETLVQMDAAGLETMSLAGTQPLAPGADPAAVAWTDKFIREQALVSANIRAVLADCGARRWREDGPETVRAANLAHLRSVFRVERAAEGMSADAFAAFGAELLRQMQPTPAVCGQPREAARAFLAREEGYARDRYCGYLGPVGVDGATRLFVNLRSGLILRDAAYLHVGAGIVAGSVPAEELAETEAKSRTLGDVLGRALEALQHRQQA